MKRNNYILPKSVCGSILTSDGNILWCDFLIPQSYEIYILNSLCGVLNNRIEQYVSSWFEIHSYEKLTQLK